MFVLASLNRLGDGKVTNIRLPVGKPVMLGRQNVAHGDVRVSRQAVKVVVTDDGACMVTRVGSSPAFFTPQSNPSIPIELVQNEATHLTVGDILHLVIGEIEFVVKEREALVESSKTEAVSTLLEVPTPSQDLLPTQALYSPEIDTASAKSSLPPLEPKATNSHVAGVKRSRKEADLPPPTIPLARQSSTSAFANTHIFVYPHGKEISSAKIAIWASQVRKAGGMCEASSQPFTAAKTLLSTGSGARVVIIIDASITVNQLERYKCSYDDDMMDEDGNVIVRGLEVHTTDWIIKSLANKNPCAQNVSVWKAFEAVPETSPVTAAVAPTSVVSAFPATGGTLSTTLYSTSLAYGGLTSEHPFWDTLQTFYKVDTAISAASKPAISAAVDVSSPPATAGIEYNDDGTPRIQRPAGFYQCNKGGVAPHLVDWLYSLGDELARVGAEGKQPMPCPFSHTQLQEANASLMRSCPWMFLAVPANETDPVATVAPETTPVINPCGLPSRPNYNAKITSQLKQLLDVYGCLPAAFGEDYAMKHRQLEAAIGTIASLGRPIRTMRDIKGLPTLEAKTLEKVEQILHTGSLQRSIELMSNPRTVAMQAFCKIHGVGPSEAARLYAAGARTLDDLRGKLSSELKPMQRISLPYTETLQQRMSRKECESAHAVIASFVRTALSDAKCYVVGSYRRGKATCSDIDLLVTVPQQYLPAPFMEKLHAQLTSAGIIVQDLHWGSKQHAENGGVKEYSGQRKPSADATAHTDTDDNETTTAELLLHDQAASVTLLCLCRIPGNTNVRRMDIKCVRAHQLPCALIQWTGNTVFNRNLRLYASHLGYDLNELGLYPKDSRAALMGSAPGRSHVEMKCPTFSSEFDVFSFLGLHYVPPTQRNVCDLSCCYDATT